MPGSTFNLRLARLILAALIVIAPLLAFMGILSWDPKGPGVVLVAASVVIAAFIPKRFRDYRRASRAHKGLCPNCRYPVRESDLLQRPECGRAVRRA